MLIGAARTQAADQPWWNHEWPFRSEIHLPAGSSDTARAVLLLCGRTSADGSDLRLVDEQGKQRPFAIVQHDAQLQTTLAIKTEPEKSERVWLYFGGHHADRINPLQPDQREALWHPAAGVVLRTYHKAKPQYPKTLPQLLEMVHDATPDGGDFVSGISNGYNPFGSSDQYISVYEGLLRIDKAGSYGFCSASADGSWVVVNDQTLVQWPGPHNWQGAERGQMSGSVNLQPGVARVMYYQEAGAGQQMAFMGWKPPDGDHFVPVPADQWVKVREGVIFSYEAENQTLLAIPQLTILSTIWPMDTVGQQATLLQATDHSTTRGARITSIQWDFGDGLTESGSEIQHVYFRLGRPTVKLTITDADGHTDSISAAPKVELVDVQAADEHAGNVQQYTQRASRYAFDQMPAQDLSAAAVFFRQAEQWQPFVKTARSFVNRFSDQPMLPELASGAADVCADQRQFDPKQAEALYSLALAKVNDPDLRESLMIRRAHNLAWNLGQLDSARAAYQQALDTARGGRVGLPTRRAATIGLGDIAMLSGDVPAAKQQYLAAEPLTERKPADQPAELAKLGSYPWAVDDALARGEYDEAISILDEWENSFPLQKLEGTSLLLRGKTIFIRSPSAAALRYFELAEVVNPSNSQIPEAIWLRASCLAAIGRKDEAIAQLNRVISDFSRSEVIDKARAKLAELQKK